MDGRSDRHEGYDSFLGISIKMGAISHHTKVVWEAGFLNE